MRIFNILDLITLYILNRNNTFLNYLNDTQLEHFRALLLPSKSVFREKEITSSLRSRPKI